MHNFLSNFLEWDIIREFWVSFSDVVHKSSLSIFQSLELGNEFSRTLTGYNALSLSLFLSCLNLAHIPLFSLFCFQVFSRKTMSSSHLFVYTWICYLTLAIQNLTFLVWGRNKNSKDVEEKMGKVWVLFILYYS